MGITLAMAIVVFSLVEYGRRHEINLDQSTLGQCASIFGGAGLVSSFVTALVAMAKEQGRGYGILALCFSLLSFFFYVR